MSPTYKNPGRIEFDGRIKTAENGGAFVEFPHDVEKLFGVKGRVPVDLDDIPRVIVLAGDVESAFKKAGVLETFRAMSFSHQREYHLAIEEARQAETRRRRTDKAIAELHAKKPTGGK